MPPRQMYERQCERREGRMVCAPDADKASAVQLAICSRPRIEDRLQLLMWHLARRWGRVTRDGVRLDIETLGADSRVPDSLAITGLTIEYIAMTIGR